jgi:hypothetical protein
VYPQVLNANLGNPDLQFRCGSAGVGGIWRSVCRWPFRCCSTMRPAHTLTHHGSPLSRASTESTTPDTRSTLGSTTEEDSPGGNPQEQEAPATEVREVAPPTPGAHITRDSEHPYMPTPVRSQVTTTTPADQGKKPVENDGHPINLH